MTTSRSAFVCLLAFAAAALPAGGAIADDDVIDLGGDTTPGRSCPGLQVEPRELYEEYMSAARTVGSGSFPYFSCGKECKAFEAANVGKAPFTPAMQPMRNRLSRLTSLVGSAGTTAFYGKAPPATWQALAQKLQATSPGEWTTLAGLDCNGFTTNFASRNGWSWAHPNVDPPVYATKPHVQHTSQICPGDFIVYTGARHVAVVGERVGQEVISRNGKNISLATFRVYESASDGVPTGIQETVQGIDMSGVDRFKLYHHNQPSRARHPDPRESGWNNVVVVPGTGKL